MKIILLPYMIPALIIATILLIIITICQVMLFLPIQILELWEKGHGIGWEKYKEELARVMAE